MKRYPLVIAVCLSGCGGDPDQRPPGVGTYTYATATVVRKYDLTGDHYHTRHADLWIDEKVVPYKVPGRLDESWWANLVERQTYRVLLEEKKDGRYVWHYEPVPR